ncbi:MAG: adhesin [Bacteroidales bacterium]|nr:adhesin [Bacteroidales bacterium]
MNQKTYTCTATPGYTLTTKVSSTIGKTLYFAANATTKGVEGKTEAPTDGSADWVIVTLADLKAEFKDKPASDAKPADATFLVDAQNFNRNNSRISTSWNSTAGSLAGWNSNPASAQYFYVGNGVTGDEHNDLYGQYWTANIINGGNGKVSQNVQIYREGWYRVRCKGFVSMASGSHVTAKLYANCSSNNAYNKKVSADLNVLTADLPAIDEEEDYASKFYDTKYTQAGKAFKANLYNNDLLIYVERAPDADFTTLTIGVEVANSESEDWICFDDVQLQYCGKGDLVLDETKTSADYMNKQVDPNYSYTLILKRTTKAGIWNSLVLPVELTAQQFKTAFGDDAKLSVLQGVVNHGTRIQFTSVDLTNDATKVVEPGKLYIMKPSKDANVQTGSYTKKIDDNTSITVDAPYYTINNITLKPQTFDQTFEFTPDVAHTAEDGDIKFCGTYLSSGENTIVPAGSFGLGANDGKWYHSVSDLPIKGFRCWIATQKDAAAKVSFSIDDEDMGVVTAIEGIETAPILRTQDAVYTLSGQKVRSSQSLEGLPKGIYIINNKKVIVK